MQFLHAHIASDDYKSLDNLHMMQIDASIFRCTSVSAVLALFDGMECYDIIFVE